MKEIIEVKIKGEIHKFLTENIPQRSVDTILQHNGRLLDLTEDIFKIFLKYYEPEKPEKPLLDLLKI